MQFTILTTFPNYFSSPLESSIIGRAIATKKITVSLVDIREFATDVHKTTDDRPFGGGPGMVMKIESIDKALESVVPKHSVLTRKVLLSARGKRLDQTAVMRLSSYSSLTIICGHYGDVDQRVAEHLVDEELSVGDYVLTGGEPAALILLDAVSRLLPGVLQNQASTMGESHSEPGISSPPSYTRPAEYRGWQVPSVLLSGNQAAIDRWKKEFS